MANKENNMRGVLALFKDPDQLKTAAEQVRDKNYKRFDAFTPFPVHGLEHAMGLKRSFLPWVTFVAGLTGCAAAAGFEIWTSAIDWPLNVGGKPLVSFPAFIPIMFELTVLFAGLATAFTMIATVGLPKLNPQILDPRITDDHFALFISADDPQYRESEISEMFKKAGANEVRTV